MSAITSIETRGMLEAYQAVHSPELRAQLDEENELVEQVSVNMIENAAYVLFSQGYDVDDVISYFTEATTNTIIEDYLNFSEGNLIIESVAVSDAYIEEQFEILNEGILNALRGGVQRVLGAGAGAMKGGGGIRDAAGAMLKSGTRAAKQTLGRAATGARELVKKIPGAKLAGRIAKSGAGKVLGKVGSRVLPGLGVAAYGMDAVNRAKKGDYGGAALSGLGAGLSAIPGVGLIAGLAPTAIQMATDAAGLTGDKSKKGPKIVGPKIVGPKIVGPKSSSSSGGGGSNSPAPSSTPAKPKVAPTKPDDSDAKLTNMQKWAKANPTLAAKVKPGQSGYDEISAKRIKPGPNEKKDQTPTQGNPDAKIDTKSVEADLKKAAEKAGKEAQKQLVKASYEYDAYDLVLEYLLSQGHTDTVEEAQYVMMEMDAEMIGTIVEGMGLSVGISKLVGKIGANPRTSAEEGAKNFQKNVTDPIGFGVKDAIRAVVQPADNSPEAQKARKDKYRP
jgi:hypothetical protein